MACPNSYKSGYHLPNIILSKVYIINCMDEIIRYKGISDKKGRRAFFKRQENVRTKSFALWRTTWGNRSTQLNDGVSLKKWFDDSKGPCLMTVEQWYSIAFPAGRIARAIRAVTE